MRHDTLADVFSSLKNAEHVGKKECRVPASNLVGGILEVIKNCGYIGDFRKEKEGNVESFHVSLLGKINNCSVIKPRFSVAAQGFNKWEKRYLPAVGFGIIIVTTSKGLMSHEEAKSKGIGGAMVGYVY